MLPARGLRARLIGCVHSNKAAMEQVAKSDGKTKIHGGPVLLEDHDYKLALFKTWSSFGRQNSGEVNQSLYRNGSRWLL